MRVRRRGQGLTEVVLIIALVAIGTIGVASMFGDELRRLFGSSADALAGEARVEGGHARARPVRKTLRNFGYDPAGGTNGPE